MLFVLSIPIIYKFTICNAIGIEEVQCSIYNESNNNLCIKRFLAMCDVKSGFCKCPPGTHEDKNLNRCVYNVDAELSEDSQSNKWEDDNGANTTSWNGFSFYPRWFKTTTYLSNNFTNETKNNNLKYSRKSFGHKLGENLGAIIGSIVFFLLVYLCCCRGDRGKKVKSFCSKRTYPGLVIYHQPCASAIPGLGPQVYMNTSQQQQPASYPDEPPSYEEVQQTIPHTGTLYNYNPQPYNLPVPSQHPYTIPEHSVIGQNQLWNQPEKQPYVPQANLQPISQPLQPVQNNNEQNCSTPAYGFKM